MLALQLLASGIAIGALYSVTAVGFALIFGATRIFHIAHGATFMVAAYCYLWGQQYSVVLGIGLSIAGALAFGYIVNQLVYVPIQKTRNSFFTLFVASFGMLIITQNLISIIAGSDVNLLSGPLSRPVSFGPLQIPLSEVIGLGVTVVALLLLGLFLQRTVTGSRIRAMADDVELVRTVGLNARRYATITFLLGSVLVVPAAILTSYQQGITPSTGLSVATIALVSAIAGGVGSLPGAAVGALILGVAQSLTTFFLPAEWQDAVAYGVLLLLLVVKPNGLVGKTRSA